jgi:hypothetical protein
MYPEPVCLTGLSVLAHPFPILSPTGNPVCRIIEIDSVIVIFITR